MDRQRQNAPVTAVEDYQRRKESIEALLAELRMKLDIHAQRASADSRNWGYPGDLGHVMEELGEIVGFLR